MYFIYVRNTDKEQWQMLTHRGYSKYEAALDIAQDQAQYWTYMVISQNGKDVWHK